MLRKHLVNYSKIIFVFFQRTICVSCINWVALLRRFLLSFLDTGLTFGRSLMAVFCDTSDGAEIWVVVVVGGVAVCGSGGETTPNDTDGAVAAAADDKRNALSLTPKQTNDSCFKKYPLDFKQ